MVHLLTEGLIVGSINIILMLAFEFGLSYTDVLRLRKRDANLYNAGMRATVFNSTVLGAITYFATITYCCVPGPLTVWQQVSSIFIFILVENVWYYVAHYLMHRPQLFWIHRFHHKFNTIVIPSSASAVSIPEFLLAYMAPFAIGSWVGGCDKASALTSAGIVAACNLIIHTPTLEEKMSCLPWIFVMPSDHVDHHQKLNCNYGAPVLHLDRIIAYLQDVSFDSVSLVYEMISGANKKLN
jgi:sterol desaturase/sphingolipid hydroxylase (fatty acid hydroxylase superfamily)